MIPRLSYRIVHSVGSPAILAHRLVESFASFYSCSIRRTLSSGRSLSSPETKLAGLHRIGLALWTKGAAPFFLGFGGLVVPGFEW